MYVGEPAESILGFNRPMKEIMVVGLELIHDLRELYLMVHVAATNDSVTRDGTPG
jgi:hypothetical protein